MSVIFNKHVMMAEKKTRADKKEELTMYAVLEEVLNEPTTFITEFLLKYS